MLIRRHLAPVAIACFAALGIAPAASAATITPNTHFDVVAASDGSCSLREAVIAANTNAASGITAGECPAGAAGPDQIVLRGGSYKLGIAGTGEDAAATGDLDVTESLTLMGPGPDDTDIDAKGIDRVLETPNSGVNFTVSGVRVHGGSVAGPGGGINAYDNVTLTNSAVSGNTASGAFGSGGGINAGIGVALTNSTVSGNTASSAGGGVLGYFNVTATDSTISDNKALVGSSRGGGIKAVGASLIRSTVRGNESGGNGGGIDADQPTLTDTTVSGNTAGGAGGGIDATPFGNVTVTRSTITGNHSSGSGGGISFDSSGTLTLAGSTVSQNTASMYGGGVFADDGVTLTNSTVSGNTASIEGGGVYAANTGTLSNSTVSGNTGGGDGGGMFTTTATLTGSTLKDNSSTTGDGGGMRAFTSITTSSTISGNRALGPSGDGGGLSIDSGATVIKSTVSGNTTTGDGGGIREIASLTDSVVRGNTATSGVGGGLWSSGSATLSRSTIADNRSQGTGGGMHSGAPLSVVNTTFDGNEASGSGGALFAQSGTTTLANATIARNTANADGSGSDSGGGLNVATGVTATIRNTILAANRSKSPGSGPDCAGTGTLTSQDYNLLGTNAGCTFANAGHDQIGNPGPIDPQLALLANNGGTTLTSALLPGSSALNLGNPATPGSASPGACAATDQRGEPRVDCDIGAFERDATRPNTIITKLKRKKKRATLTFKGTDAGPAKTLSFNCKIDRRAFASCSSSKVYRHLKKGRHTFQVRATDPTGNTDASPAVKRFRIRV